MSARKNYLALMAILGWFALISQFMLHMQNIKTAPVEWVIRFFSYFTIQVNVLVAVMVTAKLPNRPMKWSRFFSRSSVQSAVTLYLTVVGVTYNTILRQLQNLEGFRKVVDELLHLVIPLMLLVYWWKWLYTRSLKWSNIPAWLIYPAVYAVYVLWRGSLSQFYPYPFLDVSQLGYPRVWENSAGMVGLFLVAALILVAVGRKKKRPISGGDRYGAPVAGKL